jgi:hypothetical protein
MARFGRSYIKLGLVRPVTILFGSSDYVKADNAGLTDTPALVQTHVLTFSDSIGLTDTPSVTQDFVISIANNMGMTDVLLDIFNPVLQDDDMGLTDSVDFVQEAILFENPQDPLGLTDSVGFTQGFVEVTPGEYHSLGFGNLFIDRVQLIEKEKATESNDGKLSAGGQESFPPSPLALVTFLHGQIVGMQEGKMVPVTFRDKAQRDGYYEISTAASELTNYQNGDVVTADWTVELKRLGSDSEIDLQSRLTGAVRANDFALTGTKWHSPAIGHYAYYTGTTNPSKINRTSSDGTINVYLSIPNNISPRWGCTPVNYRGGRVRIYDTQEVSLDNEVEGIDRRISPTGWSLFNGLLNVYPTGTDGIINVSYYDGTSYIDNNWSIQRGFVTLNTLDSATVLRNDYEQCVIRLVSQQASGAGRTTVDISLKRGSRFVEIYMQNSSSTTLRVGPTVSTPSTTGTGYQIANSGTHRVACGSARTFISNDTDGGIYRDAATTADFWIGPVIDAASPGTGDSVTNLRDQYIGSMPEVVYAVRR